MGDKLLYYPIYHDPAEPGYQRSKKIKEWVDDYLIPAGQATMDEDQANAYLIATGDGGLMRVAHERYAKEKIMVGVNCGRLGFLLNPIEDISQIPKNISDIDLIELYLLEGEFHCRDGSVKKLFAFNDIVIGKGVLDYTTFAISGTLSYFPNRRVSGTGLVISTPQGTTAYPLKAKNSSVVLPLHAGLWYICGLATGPYPDDQVSPQIITIEIETRNQVNAAADGKGQIIEDVTKVIVRPTDKKVNLGFIKNLDFHARRRELAQKVERGEI